MGKGGQGRFFIMGLGSIPFANDGKRMVRKESACAERGIKEHLFSDKLTSGFVRGGDKPCYPINRRQLCPYPNTKRGKYNTIRQICAAPASLLLEVCPGWRGWTLLAFYYPKQEGGQCPMAKRSPCLSAFLFIHHSWLFFSAFFVAIVKRGGWPCAPMI